MVMTICSDVRSRFVVSKSGKMQKRQFADYECSHCGCVNERHLSKKFRESCGCQRSRLVSQLKTKHGMDGTRTYRSWSGMIQRCTNPRDKSFHNYGGRGVTVCQRWLNSFESFLDDMGECPSHMSIDRIDNSKGYEPGNCRWADGKTQGRNRRTNRTLTIDGISRCVVEWADHPGAAYADRIYARLFYGWSHKESVFGKENANINKEISK